MSCSRDGRGAVSISLATRLGRQHELQHNGWDNKSLVAGRNESCMLAAVMQTRLLHATIANKSV